MVTNKILFPTDFSIGADAVLVEAEKIASERGALLIVLHVQEPPGAGGIESGYYGPSESDSDAIMQMLHDVTPADKNVHCSHRLAMGDPETEILRLATSENVDLIVMGTHGRSGLQRLVLGSVAEAVIRQAPCPVLTYRMSRQPAPSIAAH